MNQYRTVCRLLTVVAASMVFSVVLAGMTMAATATSHSDDPHQNFSLNTDACASCHTAHTAAGPQLLLGASTYITCTNCHDGTESVYDVKLGQVGTTDPNSTATYDSNAGLFEGASNSRHIADGGTGIDMANYGSNGSYTGTNIFTCASCHDPHKKLADYSGNGTAYNSRLLKAAPRVVAKEDPKAVLSAAAGAIEGTGTAAIIKSPDPNSALSGAWGYLTAYPNTPTLYIRTGTAPNYTYTMVGTSTYTFDSVNGIFNINSGFNTANTYVASYWPKAPLVTINYSNYRVTTPDSTAPEVADYPDTNLNVWCSTCHNDYGLSRDAKAPSGDYTMKYRHAVSKSDQGLADAAKSGTFLPKVNGVAVSSAADINLPVTNTTPGNILCITCHYSHGSKAKSTVPGDSATINTSGGSKPSYTNSSKLLRYDNRDTCEACHNK